MKKLLYCCSFILSMSVFAPQAFAMPYCNTDEAFCCRAINCSGFTCERAVRASSYCDTDSGYLMHCSGTAGDGCDVTTLALNDKKPTNGTWWGEREGATMSPTTGRNRACTAKLDVCFGNGHQDFSSLGIVDETTCLATCNTGSTPGQYACTQGDCESRCSGAFGSTDSCT